MRLIGHVILGLVTSALQLCYLIVFILKPTNEKLSDKVKNLIKRLQNEQRMNDTKWLNIRKSSKRPSNSIVKCICFKQYFCFYWHYIFNIRFYLQLPYL